MQSNGNPQWASEAHTPHERNQHGEYYATEASGRPSRNSQGVSLVERFRAGVVTTTDAAHDDRAAHSSGGTPSGEAPRSSCATPVQDSANSNLLTPSSSHKQRSDTVT